MGNMSYCRFENTLQDLEDCREALDEGEKLSDTEEKCKTKLIKLCQYITNRYSEDEKN